MNKKIWSTNDALYKGIMRHMRVCMICVMMINVHGTQCLMQTVFGFLDHFSRDAIPTEYMAYKALQEYPLEAGVTYVAIPWAVLINKKHLDGLPRLNVKRGFTVCQHIRFEQIIPYLKSIGVDTLFTPHAMKGKSYGIRVLPFPHVAVNGIDPALKKDIFFSFVGTEYTHPVRKKIFEMQSKPGMVLIARNKWHFFVGPREREEQKKEYLDVLSRSRYSLCPRGTGPSTVRFWESLQAGAIPVIFDTDMWLPEEFNWRSCVVRIPHDKMHQTYEILKKIDKAKERNMRERCLKAYKQYSSLHIISTIVHHYHQERA